MRYTPPRHRRQVLALTCGVLVAGLAVTALVVSALVMTARERDLQRFEAEARSAREAMTERVQISISLLRGTAGLLASQGEAITLGSFRAYMDRIALRAQYPGILGIGYSRRVMPAERNAVESQIRAQGHAGFRVWPEHERPELHSIVYLEPLDQRNRAAIGYDMYTHPVRRAAMERARDGGTAAASGIVELVQEIDEQKQPGFLIYVPVYRGGAVPPTVEERRDRLLGFAYAPIRAGDFLSSAFTQQGVPRVEFSVYHGRVARPEALLFHSPGAEAGSERFRERATVDVAGQPWTFEFRSRATAAQALLTPLLVGGAGVALTVLLALLLWREAGARAAIQAGLESERAARNLAERANRMKDQFLATLSHELRTPLNAIVGWAAVLRHGRLAESEVRSAMEVVDRNARAQARLIEDLLDMNRIISGKLRLALRRTDPAMVLGHALAAVEPSAQAKGVRVASNIGSERLAVQADPARLQQVMWNLLVNAIKFTPAGGEVRVRLDPVGDRVRMTVQDTGEGIEPQLLEQIFDRFMQADGTISRRHGGLGLGLAIVRELVQMHGGSVHAESAGRGQGATFVVELPLAGAEEEVSVPEPGAAPDIRLDGAKVLVVDDERDVRHLARTVLEQAGAEVRLAAGAAEALRELDTFHAHVLVSDIGMPEMDGYELMRRIRSRAAERGGALPAVAFTAYARDEDRRAALAAGYQAHLVKPVRPDELLAAVAALLSEGAGAVSRLDLHQ